MRGGLSAKAELLSTVPLFSACSNKDLKTIARVTDVISVEAGHELVVEGTTGREFFLIVSGEAIVRKKGRKVTTLGAGRFFGEMSLLDRLPRSATVVADSDMELIVLGQREFSGLIDEIPGLGHRLLEALAQRVREADALAAIH